MLAPLAVAAQTVEVLIQDYKFIPARLTIKAGTTVKWINREKRTTHSVLFTGPGGFESERFFPDESWQRTFDTPGSYPYSCGPHPEMKGHVDVTP
jgi:plastocyanin